MPYVINNTDGTKIFYVGDQSFNTETVLSIPGRNVPDYGEPMGTNLIHMLENFADPSPPTATTIFTHIFLKFIMTETLHEHAGNVLLDKPGRLRSVHGAPYT